MLLWDWTLGPNYDLRRLENRWKLLGWLRAGLVRGGHLGTPRATFSRARDRPPGPLPLRSDEHVLGLPNLAPRDKQKVYEGNLFMRFSVSVLLLALKLVIPFIMENPVRSRIWLCPGLCKLRRMRHVFFEAFEFCMFGSLGENPLLFYPCTSL